MSECPCFALLRYRMRAAFGRRSGLFENRRRAESGAGVSASAAGGSSSGRQEPYSTGPANSGIPSGDFRGHGSGRPRGEGAGPVPRGRPGGRRPVRVGSEAPELPVPRLGGRVRTGSAPEAKRGGPAPGPQAPHRSLVYRYATSVPPMRAAAAAEPARKAGPGPLESFPGRRSGIVSRARGMRSPRVDAGCRDIGGGIGTPPRPRPAPRSCSGSAGESEHARGVRPFSRVPRGFVFRSIGRR